jgi:hypothetical protein
LPITNPAHERHPEMRAFTHLTIETGHVVDLAPKEAEWIRTRTAFARLPRGARAVVAPIEEEMLRGTARLLPDELASVATEVGISAPRDAIVGVDGRCAFVVEREDVRELELVRAQRARGPGRSVLELVFEDAWSTNRERRRRTLFEGVAPSDLDDFTERVERALGLEAAIRNEIDD